MTADALSVLAVDDERTQLEDLTRLLHDSPLVGEVHCAGGGDSALVQVSAHQFHAIFLDVRMPGLDGVELGRVLRRFASPPQLVFVSAHERGAVDAFELRALDYLLKPVSRRRLAESLSRVAAAAGPTADDAVGEDDIVAVSNPRGDAIALLQRSTILYVQSHGDFVRVVNAQGRFLLRETLSRSSAAGRRSASCASTASTSPTSVAPRRSAGSSVARLSLRSAMVRRSRSLAARWPTSPSG